MAAIFHAGTAHADHREGSRALFRKGADAAAAGRFEEARSAFRQAYGLFPHPSILFNLGLAEARLGDWVAAEGHLAHFLADDDAATEGERTAATAELATIRSHLGSLQCAPVSPPSSSAPHCFVDGSETARDQEIRLPIGPHTLRISAPGFVAHEESFVLRAGEVRTVRLPLTPTLAEESIAPRRIVGWSAIGLGGGAFLAATYTGIRTLDLRHSYRTFGDPGFQDPAVRDRGIAFRTATDGLLLGGIVAVGIGTYLVLSAPSTRATAFTRSPTNAAAPFAIQF